jgi:subtilase family serine protease
MAWVRTDVTPNAATPSGLFPADLRSAYNLTSNGSSSQTIAIVDAFDDPTAEADLAVYRAQFGLPACTTANGCFRKVAQNGSTIYPKKDGGWAQEISLDLDMGLGHLPELPHPAGRGEDQLVRQPRHVGQPGGDAGRERDQ